MKASLGEDGLRKDDGDDVFFFKREPRIITQEKIGNGATKMVDLPNKSQWNGGFPIEKQGSELGPMVTKL